jgi:mannosyltransferase
MSTLNLPAQPDSPSQITPVQRTISTENVALGFITVLCGALRTYHLGRASLWSDEIFSRYYADLFGLHYLLTEGLSKETNPPTYYLLLHGWIALWGAGEVALRSFSLVASTLCVPVIYLLGRELSGSSQGLLGALLFALCPTSLYFAQETRVYALLMLSGAVLLWAAAVFLRNARSIKAAAVYALFATLCLYLHATGLLFVVACGSVVWLFFLTQGPSGRQALLKWTALNAFVLFLGVPYYLLALTASKSGAIGYVPAAGLHQIIYCVSLTVSGIVTPYPWPGFLLAAAVFLTLVVSLSFHRPSNRANVSLIAVPCLFVALVVLFSRARPILLPRTLVWAVVPICLIAGSQLLGPGRVRYAVLLSLLAAFGTGLFFQMTAPNSDKEPWRDISRTLTPALEQADLVVLSPVSNPMVLSYLGLHLKSARLWDASIRPTIMSAAAKRLDMASISEPEILQAILTNHSVWVLSHSFDLGRVDDLRRRVPPTFYRVWFCGKVPCVAAAGWQPHP